MKERCHVYAYQVKDGRKKARMKRNDFVHISNILYYFPLDISIEGFTCHRCSLNILLMALAGSKHIKG